MWDMLAVRPRLLIAEDDPSLAMLMREVLDTIFGSTSPPMARKQSSRHAADILTSW